MGVVDSIVHKISATNTITFPDGTSRSWEHRVIRTWTHPIQLAFVLTISAWGEQDGYTNLANWGLNRKGDKFYTQITTPVLAANLCAWEAGKGVIKHTLITSDGNYDVTITLGLKTNGTASDYMNLECATNYKVDWNGKKGTGSALLNY